MAMRINTEGQFEEVNPANYAMNWKMVSHHVQALKAWGLKVIFMRKTPDQEKGKTDIFCILNPTGRLLCIEIKIGSDVRSKFQKDWQERAKKAGAIVMEEVKTYEQFLELYNNL